MKQKAIRLADELICQLGSSERGDTLSCWAAHYLAEQMVVAEAATGPEKAAAEDRCFKTILALWAHRNSLPDGLRPLAGFEPILRTLARLDPDAPRSMYLLHEIWRGEPPGEPSEVEKLCAAVVAVDRMARIVMDFLLQEAAAKATAPATVNMLENALPTALKGDLESIQELTLLRKQLEKGKSSSAHAKKRRRDRLTTLDRLIALCQEVRRELPAEAAPAAKRTKAK